MSLQEKYNGAVAKFIKSESKKQSVLGMFVAGSFVSKQLSENSDVDIFIIHDKDYSQIKAKFFNDIEFECAYKPYEQFLRDLEDKNAFDVSRYAQAKSLYDPENKVKNIISKAKKIFKRGSKERISDSDKYHLKDMLEAIEDNLENPTALITMVSVFNLALKVFYKKNNLWGVKDKVLIDYLNAHDKKMATLTKDFLNAKNNNKRFVSLKIIRDYVMNGVQPLSKFWRTKKKFL